MSVSEEADVKTSQTARLTEKETLAMGSDNDSLTESVADGTTLTTPLHTMPNVLHPDDALLRELVEYPVRIGFLGDPGDPGAEACVAFPLTVHEALELVRYWATRAYDIAIFVFLYGCCGVSDFAAEAFAWRRVDQIKKALGEDRTNEIIATVEDDFHRRLGDYRWDLFQNGSEDEVREMRQEISDYMDGRGISEYAADHLAEEAVKRFPRLPTAELAAALRVAAETVEEGSDSGPSVD